MKDIMELARLVLSLEDEKAEKELYEIIKKDKQFLYEIVMMYIREVLPDVMTIKNIVNDYQNPLSLEDEKDSAEVEIDK